MKFRAIGFDYSGVIAGMPGSEFERRASKLLNIDTQLFKDTYFKFNYLLNHNILTTENFWKKLLVEFDREDKYKELITFIKNLPTHEINKQILELADKLKANGYKTGLLSNNTTEAANKIRGIKLTDHFDAVLVSAEIGCSKPDPKVFKVFTERLGVKTKELIYIDDTPRSLETSKEVGFYPILFKNYKLLLTELKKIGIKI
jgi:putative hydrolase of the HAD superfamily